jgi:hypothetical protein
MSATFDIPPDLNLSVDEAWELGVYVNSNFGNAASMMDFLEVNAAGGVRESVATAAGVWVAGEFITLTRDDGGLVLKEGGNSATRDGYDTFNEMCALP